MQLGVLYEYCYLVCDSFPGGGVDHIRVDVDWLNDGRQVRFLHLDCAVSLEFPVRIVQLEPGDWVQDHLIIGGGDAFEGLGLGLIDELSLLVEVFPGHEAFVDEEPIGGAAEDVSDPVLHLDVDRVGFGDVVLNGVRDEQAVLSDLEL